MPKKKSRRPAARARTQTGRPSLPHRTVDAALGPPAAGLAAVNEAAKDLTAIETNLAAVADGPVHDGGALTVTGSPWKAALAERHPRALGLTYTFHAEEAGDPYPVEIRFRGHRLGVPGPPEPRDVLDVVKTIPRVVPGSGCVAVTTRVLDITDGTWQVQAEASVDPSRKPLPSGMATGGTGYAPMVRVVAPGVVLGAWPGLVLAGVALGLLVQGLLAHRLGFSGGRALIVTLFGCAVGLVGGKLYFLALHRDRQMSGMWMVGMAVQGFVLALLATAVAGAAVAHLPLGAFLDATGTGLLFGLSVGRLGCFFGGCCAGRPTGSRWGVWSSDRQYGLRRVPTQLLESAGAGVLALTATSIIVWVAPMPRGTVFLGGIAAYTLLRQVLFPLRDLPRTTSSGRHLVMVATIFALLADFVIATVY